MFHPHVTLKMRQAAFTALGQKIIGQGKKVDQFEARLKAILKVKHLLTTNCATSALELAYHLLDLKPGNQVIVPVFTFAATTLPLLRRGIKLVFADVNDHMLLDWNDAVSKITPKTKTIVNAHLFNQFNQPPKLGIPIIGDAAQYLAKTRGEQFTTYSFQATKMLTTVDGGVLACRRKQDYNRAKLLRWYGLDRETDQNVANTDIREAGFKYNMNNVAAAIGLAALPALPRWQAKITKLERRYREALAGISGIKIIGGSPLLIHTHNRTKLIQHLASHGIEAGLSLKRNDLYTVFGGKRLNLPNMNRLESTYLLLPCRANMSVKQVDYICQVIHAT